MLSLSKRWRCGGAAADSEAVGVSHTTGVARWTPEGTSGTWSALGTGVNHSAYALAWGPDDVLYVGGTFTSAGGVAGTSRIARWTPDGSGGTWSALGSGLNNSVWTLAWGPDGALYAGGFFTSAGGVEGASYAARWVPDGTDGAWSALGSGMDLGVSAFSWRPDGVLYVGGQFSSVAGVAGTRHIAARAPDAEGGGWSPVGAGLSGPINELAWGPDGALYAGGRFSVIGVPGARGIARWTPTSASNGSWSALGDGVDGDVRALVWGPDGALYVGGWFISAGDVPGTSNIARWTPEGTSGIWSALGEGLNSAVEDLVWSPDGALYVGGHFTSAGGGEGGDRIARWTPSGTDGAWSALGEGVNDYVQTLAWGPDDALYVGGRFTSASAVAGTSRIARWTPDGADGTWSALGQGVSNFVGALLWGPDGALYVGGTFTSAGGVPGLNRIARWTPTDGTNGSWSALGDGVGGAGGGRVYDLGWGPDGALYVAGNFVSAGGDPEIMVLARWMPDGAGGTWSALGSGVNQIVETFVWGTDDVLYVGGRFTTAGGRPSAYFARWTGNTTSAKPDAPRSTPLAFEAAYPNPFTTRTTFVFSVAAPAEIHLAVYDVLGRRVATLAEEHVGAGTHERVFDGTGLPNGTYLVRLSSGGESQTRRVLLVR